MQIPGLIVPPLTPFTADLKVDYDLLRREVDYVVTDCCAAMVSAAGVETQEYHYLPFDQRKELLRKTAEFVDGRTSLAIGVSHPSVSVVMELVELAVDLKAEAVQLLAPQRPYGGAPSKNDLVGYFNAVAEHSPLPIILYMNPGPGAEVPPDWAIEICKIDNVKYVKESSRDLSRVSRLIVEIDHGGLAKYFTTTQMLLASLMLGGSGIALPPPAAYIARRILEAFRAKDFERAAELQLQFALFPAKWMSKGLAPVLKASMEIIGLSMGDPYPPFQSLTKDEKEDLAAALRKTCLFEGEESSAHGKKAIA